MGNRAGVPICRAGAGERVEGPDCTDRSGPEVHTWVCLGIEAASCENFSEQFQSPEHERLCRTVYSDVGTGMPRSVSDLRIVTLRSSKLRVLGPLSRRPSTPVVEQ